MAMSDRRLERFGNFVEHTAREALLFGIWLVVMLGTQALIVAWTGDASTEQSVDKAFHAAWWFWIGGMFYRMGWMK